MRRLKRAAWLCSVAFCSIGCGTRAQKAQAPTQELAAHDATAPRPPARRVGEPTSAEDDDADAPADPAQASSTEESEVVEDEAEEAAAAEPSTPTTRPHPLDGWTQKQIRDAVHTRLASLGSMSIGPPNAGALLNGVRARASDLFELVDASHAWGTEETLTFLEQALRKVHDTIPDTPPLALGHISAEHGGPLRPHVSHQAGRDLDISFFYVGGARWYTRGTESNLDLARTWAFVRALVTETDVEMILIDQEIQQFLLKFALAHGEDRAWVEGLFQHKGAAHPIIRHAPGHATHIHVRFFNPLAQETARRAGFALVSEGILPPLVRFVVHRTKRGDTLGKIAKHYSVSVAAIREANGLRSNRIREQRDYRIPIRSEAPLPTSGQLRFPARRVPPRSADKLGPVSAR